MQTAKAVKIEDYESANEQIDQKNDDLNVNVDDKVVDKIELDVGVDNNEIVIVEIDVDENESDEENDDKKRVHNLVVLAVNATKIDNYVEVNERIGVKRIGEDLNDEIEGVVGIKIDTDDEQRGDNEIDFIDVSDQLATTVDIGKIDSESEERIDDEKEDNNLEMLVGQEKERTD